MLVNFETLIDHSQKNLGKYNRGMRKINCVLLVDDDGTTNFINYRLIKQLNITEEIHTEYNGEKALNFLQFYAEGHSNEAPELILLDLKMPVLDGYEFLEYLRMKKFENKEKIKVIVLTTSTRKDDMEKLKKFNVTIINKPLTPENFLQSFDLHSVSGS